MTDAATEPHAPSPEDVAAFFTRADGQYLFARWERPVAPVVLGVEDPTIGVVKGAVEAMSRLTGHPVAETDPELGVNLMVVFVRRWQELLDTRGMDRLVPDLAPLVERLRAAEANQYRLFRFEASGAIRAAFVFVRMDDEMAQIPAEVLALAQVAQSWVLWSDAAFRDRGPLAASAETTVLRPEVAAILRAGYDPLMPAVARDPAHALRLYARLTAH